MEFIEILYITIAVAVVILTVTAVWLSNELISLIKSVKRSSRDSEKVTKEIKEKVLLVSESLDRAGSAASSLVGLMEDAVEDIKPRRDKIADSLGLISGAGEHARRRQEKESEVEVKTEKVKEKNEKEKPAEDKVKEAKKDKESDQDKTEPKPEK
jgi:hypothetical protein